MSKKTYEFVVSTEAVNSYGSRIITDGIDTEQYMKNPIVLYMHNRSEYSALGNEVIGRTVALKKENGKLIAEIEFDEKEEFARQIAGKVERGFIRMCSIGADVIETSSDAHLILNGQTRETITKCRMFEISIVDIGGNDEALRLSKNGSPAVIQLLNQKNKINKEMNELKTVALALGLNAETSEAVVLQKVNELKLAKENSEKETNEWKEKFIHLQKTEASKLVDKAVSLGLLPEDLKDAQLLAFESDFNGQSERFNKLISEKEAENDKKTKQKQIADVVAMTKGKPQNSNSVESDKDSFEYLSKYNVAELRRIKAEEPERYLELTRKYRKGN